MKAHNLKKRTDKYYYTFYISVSNKDDSSLLLFKSRKSIRKKQIKVTEFEGVAVNPKEQYRLRLVTCIRQPQYEHVTIGKKDTLGQIAFHAILFTFYDLKPLRLVVSELRHRHIVPVNQSVILVCWSNVCIMYELGYVNAIRRSSEYVTTENEFEI